MAAGLSTAIEEPIPAPMPERPSTALPPREWLKENLFSNAVNSILTVVFGLLIAFALYRAVRFTFITGRWAVIEVNLTNLMVGRYPRDQLFRVWIAIYVCVAAAGFGVGVGEVHDEDRGWRGVLLTIQRTWPVLLALAVVLNPFWLKTPTPQILTVAGIALYAVTKVAGRLVGRTGMAHQVQRRRGALYIVAVVSAYLAVTAAGGPKPQEWGGLLLTVTASVAGIVLSFPFGLLLGLGRRSTFPVFRLFSVGFIEIVRGVPLISILFISSVTVGLFLPPGSGRLDLVVRGLIGIILFTAAYLAETVRGGLQSVPKGQLEAARAIGLSPLKTTRLIILPQALRNVIPTLVGQFISLWKDTSLLGIIGVLELLGIAQAVLVQGDFRGQGLQAETLVFAAFLYWVACYTMSRASQRLERRLGVGER